MTRQSSLSCRTFPLPAQACLQEKAPLTALLSQQPSPVSPQTAQALLLGLSPETGILILCAPRSTSVPTFPPGAPALTSQEERDWLHHSRGQRKAALCPPPHDPTMMLALFKGVPEPEEKGQSQQALQPCSS